MATRAVLIWLNPAMYPSQSHYSPCKLNVKTVISKVGSLSSWCRHLNRSDELFVKTFISPYAEVELRETCSTRLMPSKTLVAKAQFSFPFISIQNPHYRGSSSRYFVRVGKPSAPQSKDSKEAVKCLRVGDVFCQSWILQMLNTWDFLQPELKTARLQRRFSSTLFTTCPVPKIILLLILISLHFSATLFVFVFHLFSWFLVLSSCLKWLIF